MAKAKLIRIDHIRVLFFVRTALNPERIQFFRELYEHNETVTPVTLAEIPKSHGESDQYYELIAGRHRVEGCAAAGYITIESFVEKFESEQDKIMYAVTENVGGSLTPTTADYEHSMELLIMRKMPKREILDSYPLPKPITAKIYKASMDKIYRRTIRKAVDDVIVGNITVKAASEKYDVKIEDLKRSLSSRDIAKDHSVSKLLGQLDFPMRSLGQNLGAKAKQLIEAYEAGEASVNDIEIYRHRIKTSLRNLQRNVTNICERFDTVLNPDKPEIIETKATATEKPAPILHPALVARGKK